MGLYNTFYLCCCVFIINIFKDKKAFRKTCIFDGILLLYFSDSYIHGTEPYVRPSVDIENEPIRRITPLEGYRLQGFPDEYADIAKELGISYSAQYKLIGNALPVDLATAVIKYFMDNVFDSMEEVKDGK